MKKILLLISCLPTLLFAQSNSFFVGGSLSLNSSHDNEKTLTNLNSTTDYTSFNFAPEMGYYLSSRVAVGIAGGYSYSRNKNAVQYTTKQTQQKFMISPFVLYHFYTSGKFTFVGKGALSYLNELSKQDEHVENAASTYTIKNRTRTLLISASPGVTYQVSRHFRIESYFGSLGYKVQKFPDRDGKAHGFNLWLSDGLSFGLHYCF
jgi:outer membrane protein